MHSEINPRLTRAKWILGYFPSEKIPSFAADALEAGLDGPSLRRIAGFLKPNHWELQPHLGRMWMELGVPSMTNDEALDEILKESARQIISEPQKALQIAKGLWPLCYKHDWDKRIWYFLEPEEYRPIYYSDEEAMQRLVDVSVAFLGGKPISPGKSQVVAKKYRRRPVQLYYRARLWLRRRFRMF